MKMLFESKVMSRDQIRDMFFKDSSKQVVNRRLNKMMSAGLVSRKPLEIRSRVFYSYSVTSHGLSQINSWLPYTVVGKTSRSECPFHDLALVDLRQLLSRKGMVTEYSTESMLQSTRELSANEKLKPFVELNSDAVVSVKTKIGILDLALEYESARKNISRYKDKLESYYRRTSIQGVLYVCSDQGTLNVLHRVDQETAKRHQSDQKVYCAQWNDINDPNKECVFKNADGYIFRVL